MPKVPCSAEEIRQARQLFPRGLSQPEGSFRFSRDALILADFATQLAPKGASVADLGAGCGVVGFALLLTSPEQNFRVVAVELQEELVQAARINAVRLGLMPSEETKEAGQWVCVAGDVRDRSTLRATREALAGFSGSDQPLFDLVVCNPPWRLEGKGRIPPSPARRTALFGTGDTLGHFFSAADALLCHGGALAAIVGTSRLADALAALPRRLKPVRLLFVHPKPDAEAGLVLLEARKGMAAALRVAPPLFLQHTS